VAEAISAISVDQEHFRASFDAYRAWDADSFQRLLDEFKIADRCDLVCEWISSKDCVLMCLELCGPPPEGELPDLREFAEVVERITGEERLVGRLALAVSERDGDAYRALVSELEIEPFCHLLCHWVCAIRGRLICRVVCSTERLPRIHLVDELVAAGQVLGRLTADEDTFALATKAAVAGDCEDLGSAIGRAGLASQCEIICEWICSWRCIRVCLSLCRAFPFAPFEDPLSEAFEFAKAVGRLADQPETLERLSAAVASADADSFTIAVKELKLEPFCIQLCHWIWVISCREFCDCVCPNPQLDPWFTTVGYFDIYADIDPTTGRTNKGLPDPSLGYGGGPSFAFFSDLQLGGFCPITSPVYAGVAMQYRFLYDDGSGPAPITGDLVSYVNAGSRFVDWPANVAGIAQAATTPTFQTIAIAKTASDPTPPATGAPWYGPGAHVIAPDPQGWVAVDQTVIGEGFTTLMGFATAQAVAGGDPLPGVPAGTAVPTASQRTGTDLSITFEASRVTVTTVDFSNALNKILINNWGEVNELDFTEFVSGDCCTPIDDALDVEYTVDHEELDAGGWSLEITSCSPSAPGDITPPATTTTDSGAQVFPTGTLDVASTGGFPTIGELEVAGVTGLVSYTGTTGTTFTGCSGGIGTSTAGGAVTLRPREAAGTIPENTTSWENCSYVVTLTTRPGLTTGMDDRDAMPNPLTFCICGHN